jgi:hypothetical protein
MKFTLEPIGSGSVFLNSFDIDTNHNQTIVLGRNAVTGLDKPCDHIQNVSRSHVVVSCRDGRILMDVVSRQDNIVHLNDAVCERGEIELKEGDTLSLLGSLHHFNYKLSRKEVEQEDKETLTQETVEPPVLSCTDSKKRKPSGDPWSQGSEDAHSKKESKPSAAISSSSAIGPSNPVPDAIPPSSSSSSNLLPPVPSSKSIVDGLLRQYECEICYEVMACSYALNPSGDCFCYSCIEDWASGKKDRCPHCQGPFDLKTAIPMKKMDNAVREMLKSDPEQLKEWEARANEGIARNRKFQEKGLPYQQPQHQQQPPQNPFVMHSQTNPAARGSIVSHFRFLNVPNPNNSTAPILNANNLPYEPAVPAYLLANGQNGNENRFSQPRFGVSRTVRPLPRRNVSVNNDATIIDLNELLGPASPNATVVDLTDSQTISPNRSVCLWIFLFFEFYCIFCSQPDIGISLIS